MRVYSWIFDGIDPKVIQIEYHSRFQIPSFSILGLPGPEIQEARERIIAAFHASEIEFPKKKLVINLAPASIKKWGTGHDLPIAIAILQQAVELKLPPSCLAWGELGLQGEIKPRGQMAALVELLLRHPVDTLVLAPADAEQWMDFVEWRRSEDLRLPEVRNLVRVGSLRELVERIERPSPLVFGPCRTFGPSPREAPSLLPLSPSLERTLEIALTGRHHLLLLGPKGIGKSHSLEWLKALSPAPESALRWSRALRDPAPSPRTLQESPIRPVHAQVRPVHAQVRPAHLLGSWRAHRLESGELALAHGGLLIADEFLEWPRDSRECLREPLQNRSFLLSRVAGKVTVECDFQFAATGNLCPCGGFPTSLHRYATVPPERLKRWRCRCRPHEIEQYLGRLSGPIADRIDLVSLLTEFPDPNAGARSVDVLARKIEEQRVFARERLGALPGELTPGWLEKHAPRGRGILRLLDRLPSLRARHKALRIAATLQCLERSDEITEEQVFEASAHRFMDTWASDSAMA